MGLNDEMTRVIPNAQQANYIRHFIMGKVNKGHAHPVLSSRLQAERMLDSKNIWIQNLNPKSKYYQQWQRVEVKAISWDKVHGDLLQFR